MASNSSRLRGSAIVPSATDATLLSRENEPVTRRGWLLFVAMAVICGIPYLLIKIAVAELAPSTLVLLRTTVGGVILVPLALARGDVRPLLSRWRGAVSY